MGVTMPLEKRKRLTAKEAWKMPDSNTSVIPRSSVMFSCWLRLFVTCSPP